MIKCEIIERDGYYNLYVNGSPQVCRETLSVCESVRDALQSPMQHKYYSEGAEIADTIRRVLFHKE